MSGLYFVAFILFVCFGFVAFRGSPYVPSHKKDIQTAFSKLYPISKKDVLLDVGSGDGIVLREAARLGAKKAIGHELNPIMVVLSKIFCSKYKQIEIKMTDFWLTSIPDEVNVIYIFFATRDIKKFIEKVESESKRIKHDIYVISYGAELTGKKIEKKLNPYYLYKFSCSKSLQ